MINTQVLTEKAKELINCGNLNEAEKILLGLNDKYSIFELARIRKIQGRSRDAEQLYLKSLSMKSEIKSHIESDINIELGRIYAGFGNIELAKERFEKGADRICLEKNIYRELGELYFFSRYYKEAEENFEKAMHLFPDDIKTNLDLAITYRMLEKDDLSKQILIKLLSNKQVKNSKFLYNKVLNEYEIAMRKEVLESKPREIRNTITNKCNIGCRYCDIWKEGTWEQSEERTKEIINLFPYLENMQWLGGETFLYKGFEEILEEGAKYDTLSQTILTNGLLLNERILEKISKANISLLIAIDAGKKETYEYLRRGSSWEKLCANLELIKEINKKTNRKIYTTFNAVISKSNYKEMFEMVEMAHKYDFNKIRFMPILGSGEENIFSNNDRQAIEYIYSIFPFVEDRAKQYNIVLEQYIPTRKNNAYKDNNLNVVKSPKELSFYHLKNRKRMGCTVPWKMLVIDSKGPIRPCVNCNDWIGDSTKQSIDEFWNSIYMRIYRKQFGNMYSCKGTYNIDLGPNDVAKVEMHF